MAGGPPVGVETFEAHVESYLGKGTAIACASGHGALSMALAALDVGPGDEVVTTPYGPSAAADCITALGAVPVFADIDPQTYNIDLAQAASKIGDRTKAFLPVHMFGQTAPLEEIYGLCRERNAAVVEDAAQAFGSWRKGRDIIIVRAGVMGDVGRYSFFPAESPEDAAGMAVALNGRAADRIKTLRALGEAGMDAAQAAILDAGLARVEELNARRRVLADRYRMFFAMQGLGGFVTLPAELEGNFHIYSRYVVRTPRRDELARRLEELGIAAAACCPVPLHLRKRFASLGYGPGDFPEAERMAAESLALPISSGLTPEEQERTACAVADFFRPA